jgi:hypothetical protein
LLLSTLLLLGYSSAAFAISLGYMLGRKSTHSMAVLLSFCPRSCVNSGPCICGWLTFPSLFKF